MSEGHDVDGSGRAAITGLVARYAELVDDGDFAGLGLLLADAVFAGSGGAVSGGAAIERMFRDTIIVYPDGTPRTHHVVGNLVIDVEKATASARSYFTVFQAVPGSPLQPIVAGRYRDRFACREGRWHFTERRVDIRLVGDASHHLRQELVADRRDRPASGTDPD
jgi:3-phenylpropionate/cinnamic acid dioxygenase small subunit